MLSSSGFCENNVIIVTDRGERRLTLDPGQHARDLRLDRQSPGCRLRAGSKIQDSTSNISISHEVVAERLVNYEQLMKEVNISPEHPGIEGLRLGAVTADSRLTRFGLRTGDVIKEMNGEEITGPDDAETFFQTLAGGGKLTIVVERRGRLQKLNLSDKLTVHYQRASLYQFINMALTRSEIIKALLEEVGLTEQDAQAALSKFWGSITMALGTDRDVRIRNFGDSMPSKQKIST